MSFVRSLSYKVRFKFLKTFFHSGIKHFYVQSFLPSFCFPCLHLAEVAVLYRKYLEMLFIMPNYMPFVTFKYAYHYFEYNVLVFCVSKASFSSIDNRPPPKKKPIKFRNYVPKDETLKEKKIEDTKPQSGI